MENLVIYLIKSSTLLLFFFTTYYFLLKKETFFTANRWFLIAGIFCSALLPLLTFEKIVLVDPVISSLQSMNIETTSTTITNIATLEENAFSWELLLIVLYGLGVFVFLSKLIIEFYSLKKIINSNNKKQADGCEFIEVNQLITPFSFFNKIVYNPSLFQTEELKNIIEHEKIHAKQLHSLDVLIARMYCILFWWNPLVWMYKKAMVQNLEFIADQNALAKAVDKKSYLLTLLKITTAENPVAITNHFYQSLIKKRIVMLNTNQSKKQNSWKYFVVIPALVFFMLTYQVEVVAQEKTPSDLVVKELTTSKVEMLIDASSTNEVIYQERDFFKKEFGISLKFTKIRRNKKKEITKLSVTMSDKKGTTKVYDVSDSEAIKPFTIFVNTDYNGHQTFGFGAPKENQHLKNHFDALERSNKIGKAETDKSKVNEATTSNNVEMYFKTSDGSDNINLIKEDKNTDYKKALILLNEKEISSKEMELIDPMKIGSVIKLNFPNNDKLIAKYGEKAKDGVILIETMDYEKTTPGESKWDVSTEPFKLDKENGGVIVHKRSQKSNFEFIQKELEKIGVNAKISGIKRNAAGFITAIKIKLVDKERNHKVSENWTTSRNPNGIPDISIGRKNGKIVLKAK